MLVRVAGAEEAAGLDASAVESGISSRALMRVAAANAASVIASSAGDRLVHGVTVFTGPGNNGGDGWAVASALRKSGVRVAVREILRSRTPDALAERELASRDGDSTSGDSLGTAGIVIDALLGFGARGRPRDAIADAVTEINNRREQGAFVVALDVPTGLDATTGECAASVVADITINFGTCKRGALVSRSVCGRVVVVDVGLPTSTGDLPELIDADFVHAMTPAIAPDAHKGTRKSIVIVAGGEGMGGAAIVAAIGALRSAAGRVKVATAKPNIGSIQVRIPEAMTTELADAAKAIDNFADAVLIGPGLGRSATVSKLVREVLETWRGPVVVDADALNVFGDDVDGLGDLLRGRPAVITPHPAELGRLIGASVADVLANRFDIGLEVAARLDAAVLLKGTPTVITGPNGARYVVAAGTPVLATGGSGDTLGGIAVTLLAQSCEPAPSAACAAWVHGRAAELTPGVRGFTIEDVVERLRDAWRNDAREQRRYPVLATLPALS